MASKPPELRSQKTARVHIARSTERLARLLARPSVQFLIFAGFLAVVVTTMSSGFDMRDRVLGDEDLGRAAPFTLRATADFRFSQTDEQATRALRDKVASGVAPVYDWQEALGEQLRDKVRLSFASMREAMAARLLDERRQRNAARAPAPTPTTQDATQDGPGATPTVAPSPEPPPSTESLLAEASVRTRIKLARELRASHFDPSFPAGLRAADYEAFAATAFNPEIENALAVLLGEVMSNLIVSSQRVIERERNRGIFLRRLRDDKVLIEYQLTDLQRRVQPFEGLASTIREVAAEKLPADLSAKEREAIVRAAALAARPNTVFNASLTQQKRDAARASVAAIVVTEQFRKGQVIVDKGALVTARHLQIAEAMREETSQLGYLQIVSGLLVLALIVVVVFFVFGRLNIHNFALRPKDIYFLGTTLLLFLVITRLGKAIGQGMIDQVTALSAEAWSFSIPVAGFGMLVRLVLRSEHAVVAALAFSLLVGFVLDSSLFYTAYTAIGCLVGAATVRQVKNRMTLMWSGLVIGATNAMMVIAYQLLAGELFTLGTLTAMGMAFAGGILAGLLVSAVLPVVETGFGYTTDIKLLELANLNHPLLRDLIMKSPGSYHHSMMVGSLCESACEAIGANALLARVGAYYHDIGKMKNPGYFAENQKVGENPHDKLKPNMSALIIKSHVKDGLELARQARLPRELHDFIAQHHGTSLIAYFYHKAKQLEDPDIPEVDEKDYRYPGPKPQTRETAICMLADGIEAASRAMKAPSQAKLKGLVQTMINKAFTDGQLDECDLTLKDLNSIAGAFTRILTGIYHHRPEYPGAKKGQAAARRKAHTTGETRRGGKVTGQTPAVSVRESGQHLAVDGPKTGQTEAIADDSHDSAGGERGEPPAGGEPGDDAATEGRASLPRLGA